MEGLLLKFTHRKIQEPSFWKLFGSIRHDLDRLFWIFTNQPWFAPPEAFMEDETALVPFEGQGRTSVQLWRDGTLSRYADSFTEELIELWAVEPTRDDPQAMAALYNKTAWGGTRAVIRQHAHVWLRYIDGTCWEIYARKISLLERLRTDLSAKPWVAVYNSRDDEPEGAYRAAGLYARQGAGSRARPNIRCTRPLTAWGWWWSKAVPGQRRVSWALGLRNTKGLAENERRVSGNRFAQRVGFNR